MKFRKQALAWLNDELVAWRCAAMTTGSGGRTTVARTLAPWKQDSDLAGIRDEAGLAKLPEEEHTAFVKLWANVDALLAKIPP